MNTVTRWLTQWAAPEKFFSLSGHWLPWLMILTLGLMLSGLWGGLVIAPADWQQGHAFRIIYIHVPSALLSMMVYVWMAVAAAIFLIWRIKIAQIFALSAAYIGAGFTIIALITGSIWGKPMWGTWWEWKDARIVSELILLFLYIGYIGLNNAIMQPLLAGKASAILAIVGLVNIPIIHYSVVWWNTLHQPATISKLAKPSIAIEMAVPLFIMIAAFIAYFLVVVLISMRHRLLWQERDKQWVKDKVERHS